MFCFFSFNFDVNKLCPFETSTNNKMKNKNLKFSQVFKVRQYSFQNRKGKINNTGLNGLEVDGGFVVVLPGNLLLVNRKNFRKWWKEEVIHYLFKLVSSVCQYSLSDVQSQVNQMFPFVINH